MSADACAKACDKGRHFRCESLSRMGAAVTLVSALVAATVMTPSQALAKDTPEVFQRAVALSLAQNPTVREAQAAYLAAKDDIRVARGQRFPQVDVAVQSSPQQFGVNANNGAVRDGTTESLRAVTPVLDWGKASYEIEAREQSAEAAKQRLIQARETVANDTIAAMLQVAKQTRLVAVTDDYMDRNKRLVEMLTQIVEIDPGRGSELVQARSRFLQSMASKDQTLSRLRDAKSALLRLLPNDAVEIPLNVTEAAIPVTDLESAIAALDKHPVVLQAQADADSALSSAKALARSNLPGVSWVVSKSSARDALNRESPWISQFQLNFGASRGGSALAAERAAIARADAARERSRQARLDIQYKLRGIAEDASSQLERARVYRDIGPQTDQVREAFYEQWYTLGKRSLFDLLNAEADHFNTVSTQITSLFDGLIAASRLKAEVADLTRWLGFGDASSAD